MEKDAIWNVIQEKIDERMRSMFKIGDRPVEVEMGEIAGAYINKYGIARSLLESIDPDSDLGCFIFAEDDNNEIEANYVPRRGAIKEQEVNSAPRIANGENIDSALERDGIFVFTTEIGCCPTVKFRYLQMPSFSPIRLIEKTAYAIMNEEESQIFRMIETITEENGQVTSTKLLTAIDIEKQIDITSRHIIMNGHAYQSICERGLTENWTKVKKYASSIERGRNVAVIVLGGQEVSVHISDRATNVYIVPSPDLCGARCNTGNPIFICDVEPRKLQASIVAFITFGAMIRKLACRVLKIEEIFE